MLLGTNFPCWEIIMLPPSTSSLVSRQSRLKILSAERPSSNARRLPSITRSSVLDSSMPSPVMRAPKVSSESDPAFLTRYLTWSRFFSSFSRSASLGSRMEGSPRFSVHSHGRFTTGPSGTRLPLLSRRNVPKSETVEIDGREGSNERSCFKCSGGMLESS